MSWRAFVIFLVASLVYLNSLGGAFVSDDRALILDHPYTKELRYLPAVFTAGHYEGHGGYRPLTTLSFALNFQLGGTDPRGYHALNILLHAAISVLVYLVVIRLFRSENAALVTALIFAVHPIHTEAVAWISGRAELLAALFSLACWHSYLRGRLIAAALFFVAGILSKENALVLPVVMAASDLYLSRRDQRALWPRLKGYAAFAGVIVFYFAFRWALYTHALIRDANKIAFHDNPLAVASVSDRILTALKILGDYFLLLIWPRRLTADYSFNATRVVQSLTDPGLIFAVFSIGVLIAVAWVSYSRRGHLWLPIAVSFITIAPTANLLIPIGTIKAERLLYLPSVGFCAAVGLVCAAVYELLERRPVRLAAQALVASALILLSVRTLKRNADWRNELTLWLANARTAPQCFRTQLLLGSEYLRAGAVQDAITANRRALEIDPSSQEALGNLGVSLVQTGRLTEAIELFRKGTEAHPQHAASYLNLGLAYAARGDLPQATANFRRAIELNPVNAAGYLNLGLALSQLGNKEEALENYQRATEVKPDYAEAWNAMGAMLLRLERKEEARGALTRAISLRPDFPDAAHNLRLLDPR